MKMSEESRNQPGRIFLRSLLLERNQYPDRAEVLDAKIRDRFERELAVMVLDMVGFSRLSEKHGIITFLAMMAEMLSVARPAIIDNGGKLIKAEADNLFAVFEDTSQALDASLDVFRAFDAVNGIVPEDHDIHGSIGIGCGPTLVIDDEDLFGCEVNLASKLGEDIAEGSEILLSQAALDSLETDRYRFDPCRDVIGGKHLDYYRFRACVGPDGAEHAARSGRGR